VLQGLLVLFALLVGGLGARLESKGDVEKSDTPPTTGPVPTLPKGETAR
jgi:hypothetical protein